MRREKPLVTTADSHKGTLSGRLAELARHSGIGWPLSQQQDSSALQVRAERRQRLLQVQQQQNLETIFQLADKHHGSNECHARLDPDWFHSFTQLACQIYNPAMQALWAGILAAELMQPGNFTLKALTTLKKMTATEAELLRRASRLLCRGPRYNAGQIILGYVRPPKRWKLIQGPRAQRLSLGNFGLPWSDIMALHELGILFQDEILSGPWQDDEPLPLYIGAGKHWLKARRPGLQLIYLRYTETGLALSRLLPKKHHEGYFQALQRLLSADFDWS